MEPGSGQTPVVELPHEHVSSFIFPLAGISPMLGAGRAFQCTGNPLQLLSKALGEPGDGLGCAWPCTAFFLLCANINRAVSLWSSPPNTDLT